MNKQQDDVRVSKELNFMRSVNLDTLSKEKPMSYMLMDYFVITSGDEYSDTDSENSDDHAISSDESKCKPRAGLRAGPRPVDDALLSRPTTSTGIAKAPVKHARLEPPTDTVLRNGGSAQGGPGHQDQDFLHTRVGDSRSRFCSSPTIVGDHFLRLLIGYSFTMTRVTYAT